MSKITLQEQINERKRLFLQTLKEQGLYLDYCIQRGYIYELTQSVAGCITRIVVSLKNGELFVLSMEPSN